MEWYGFFYKKILTITSNVNGARMQSACVH